MKHFTDEIYDDHETDNIHHTVEYHILLLLLFFSSQTHTRE